MLIFKYKFIGLTLLILQAHTGYSKNVNISTEIFNRLNYEQGLPSNITNSIAQDNAGFIWIGTGEGLCRYDGLQMIYFNKSGAANTLPSDRISALLHCNNKLWVGTWKGLCTIDTRTFEIQLVDSLNTTAIRTLLKGNDGKVWVGTNNGLRVYNQNAHQVHVYRTENSNISHNTIRSLYIDDEENLWVGTFNGLNRFDGNRFISFDLKGDYKPEIRNNLILSIQPDEHDPELLWVGTETGLCSFNTKDSSFKNFNSGNSQLSNEVIKSILIKEGKVWLGTDYGLNILDPKNGEVTSFFHNPNVAYTISNNVIWTIFEDEQQTLWFLTDNGISLLNTKNKNNQIHQLLFEINGQLAGNQLRDILVRQDGSRWFATTHGIIKQQPDGSINYLTDKNKLNEQILIDNCFSLETDTLDRIWIGTAKGINIRNEETNSIIAITANPENGLTSNYIHKIKRAPDGVMWVETWGGGLYKVTGNLKKPDTLKFVLITHDGEALFHFLNQDLIFYSYGSIWRIKQGEINAEKLKDFGLYSRDNEITAMQCDSAGNIWMAGTSQLFRYNPSSGYLHASPIETVSHSRILSMEIDQSNCIWLATRNSVLKYDANGTFITSFPLNTHTPLKSFFNQCSYYQKNGSLFFGGENGYLEIHPQPEEQFTSSVGVNISGLTLNGKPATPLTLPGKLNYDIAYTNKIELNHNQNTLRFSFSDGNYWLSDKTIYQYRLIGYDKEWRLAQGKQAYAEYANLRNGRYTLEVRSLNASKKKNHATDKLTIIIHPPLWLSPLFISLYILLFVGILTGLFLSYDTRIRLRNRLKLAELEQQHSAEMMDVKLKFFTNISHEFRTPLSLIIPPINNALKSPGVEQRIREQLSIAQRGAQRLLTLINQIMDFRKLETTELSLQTSPINLVSLVEKVHQSFNDWAGRHHITYTFESNTSNVRMNLDAVKVETILYNLLSNALKHTPDHGAISIEIIKMMSGIQVSVSDTGKGISELEIDKVFELFYQSNNNEATYSGSGIGLTMAREYAALHKGSLTVKSEINKGSTFTLYLPETLFVKDQVVEEVEEIQAPNSEIEAKTQIAEMRLHTKRKRILLVDDNSDILSFIELLLKDTYHFTRSLNGRSAFNKAVSEQPDLIISDVMMPEMNGFELCQKLKSNESTSHIPVILLTAKSMDDQKIEGLQSGADLYITKPFNAEYLAYSIKNLFVREEQIWAQLKKIMLIEPQKNHLPVLNQDVQFVKKVMGIIEQHYHHTDFSVEKLSNEIGFSTTHLYRKLKETTGLSTQDIIKNYRLQKATHLLEGKEMNVSEVMDAVGFSGLSSFSKSFKKQFGMSPSEYMKQQAS